MKDDWVFKVVPWVIGVVFVGIVTSWVVYGVIAYLVIDEVASNSEGISEVGRMAVDALKKSLERAAQ